MIAVKDQEMAIEDAQDRLDDRQGLIIWRSQLVCGRVLTYRFVVSAGKIVKGGILGTLAPESTWHAPKHLKSAGSHAIS